MRENCFLGRIEGRDDCNLRNGNVCKLVGGCCKKLVVLFVN